MGAGINSYANKGQMGDKSSGANTARNAPSGNMIDSGQGEKALP